MSFLSRYHPHTDKKLSPVKKELLKKFVSYKCEECGNKKESTELQIHRLHRGCEYSLRNVKIVCVDCHKNMHYKEFV